jgi:thiol-disulfide isomerase/thioredoxin
MIRSAIIRFAKLHVLAALVVSATYGFGAEATLKAAKVPLQSLTGSPAFTGAGLKSELTVIQFWASWCTGCAVVMAQMSEMLPKHPHVGYVSVTLDEKIAESMKFFANKSEITKKALPLSYIDPSGEAFSQLNGVDSLPYLILVNKEGKIIKRIVGHPTKDDLDLMTKPSVQAAPAVGGVKK